MIEPLDPKTPGAKKDYGIDWGVYFAERSPDVTITSSDWAIEGELGSPDLVIEVDNVDGQTTLVRLSGGEEDRDYILINSIVTSAGEELEEAIKVRVKSAAESASL